MKAATFESGMESGFEAATATTRRGAMRSGVLLAPLALAAAPLAAVGASGRPAPALPAAAAAGPLTHMEAALPRLEETLRQHLVGQGHVVAAVAGALRRWQMGLSDPQRPVSSFLFLGPARVGKTVLVKALSHALFGGAGALTRLDASAHRAPLPALAALAAAVSRRPQQVILLDEVGRAQPEVRAALEQILETGRLADGRGRTVDFRNTVVIMTATTAAAPGLDGADGASGPSGAAGPDRPGTPAGLRPELLERIHEVVTFEHLTAAQRRLVAARMARRAAPA